MSCICYIYLITNKINHKVYIGQTKNLKNRWSSYLCEMKRNKLQYPIYKALRKYGIDNFTYEAIVCTRSLEYINQLEKDMIIKYDSRNHKIGYNVAEGGAAPNYWLGKTRSEETKIKMSKTMTGKKYPNRKSPPDFSGEHRKNISLSNIGKTHSLETKQFLADKARLQVGSKNGKYREDVSDDHILELFNSGLSSRKIAKEVGMKSHKGVLCRLHTMANLGKISPEKIKTSKHRGNGRVSTHEQKINIARAQMKGRKILCSDGRIFFSRYEASCATGVHKNYISQICNNQRKLSKGFSFKYLEQ